MLLIIVKLLLALVFIVKSADWMTDGASAIAVKFNIRPFIVGLTVVAMGTSAPELCVSLSSAIQGLTTGNLGMGDIAVGNVVGSNIFNNLLIVGLVALLSPLVVKRKTVMRDIPIVTVASLMLLLMLADAQLSRIEGISLFLCFIAFMVYVVKTAKGGEEEQVEIHQRKLWQAILFVIIGLSILVFSSDVFVENASLLAAKLGVSEKIIGLTIVGCGTSAPELATSIMAARKGQGEMAIGNVIGSNVFNIFLVLGLTGAITPLTGITINYIDIAVLVLGAVLFWLFSYTKFLIERWEGAVLTAICAAYLVYLVM